MKYLKHVTNIQPDRKQQIISLVFKFAESRCATPGVITDDELYKFIGHVIENEANIEQQMQQLKTEEDNQSCSSDTDKEDLIEDIKLVLIEPNDFIFENPGNVRDYYRIGKIIGQGTFA